MIVCLLERPFRAKPERSWGQRVNQERVDAIAKEVLEQRIQHSMEQAYQIFEGQARQIEAYKDQIQHCITRRLKLSAELATFAETEGRLKLLSKALGALVRATVITYKVF